MPTMPQVCSSDLSRRAYALITASTASACFRRDSLFVYRQSRFHASSLVCIRNEDTGSRESRQDGGWGWGVGASRTNETNRTNWPYWSYWSYWSFGPITQPQSPTPTRKQLTS